MKQSLIATSALLLLAAGTFAQDMNALKRNINTLCGTGFGGRGYVSNSRDKAARFIARQYSDIGLISFPEAPDYFQEYRFSVNTFPNRMELVIGKKNLEPGEHYLVDAASSGFRMEQKKRMHRLDLLKIRNEEDWKKWKSEIKPDQVYKLSHVDSFCRKMKMPEQVLLSELPVGAYIIPQRTKLTWTVSTDVIPATVLFVADSVIPRSRKVQINIEHKYLEKAPSKNVVGYIPGTEYPDSFIVFTAHYDHLGKMGARTIFPGANDNASGTAFNLEIARYFVAHPQKYSIAFIATSGEEAGLLGSSYYSDHPLFPLSNIKLLINIDLMSDATDGITVVNSSGNKSVFDAMVQINAKQKLLSAVKPRDNAPNSDHYPFTQKDVPAIFIYANGGKGHYHDVHDKPKEWSMNKVPEVFRLLTVLVEEQNAAR